MRKIKTEKKNYIPILNKRTKEPEWVTLHKLLCPGDIDGPTQWLVPHRSNFWVGPSLWREVMIPRAARKP